MSDYNPISSSPNKNSKTKVITLIIAIVLFVVAIAGYSYLASTKGWWPFKESTPEQAAKTEQSATQSLTISKLEVTGSDENQVLQVGLKLEGKDKGYCVLELSSKQTMLKIDDNENRKNNKDAGEFEDCLGWSVGVGQMQAGEYTAKVTFKGTNGDVTTSKQVIIK